MPVGAGFLRVQTANTQPVFALANHNVAAQQLGRNAHAGLDLGLVRVFGVVVAECYRLFLVAHHELGFAHRVE